MEKPFRTYVGVSPARFSQLEAQAQSALGMTIQGNSGQASAHGVEVAWNYDPTGQSLTFTLVSKPFYISQGVIGNHLDDFVGSRG
jgi:hypothetical protein